MNLLVKRMIYKIQHGGGISAPSPESVLTLGEQPTSKSDKEKSFTNIKRVSAILQYEDRGQGKRI